MTLFQIISVFLTLIAAVGWANALALKLPQSVAMLLAGVLTAGALFAAQALIGPFWGYNSVRDEIARLDFTVRPGRQTAACAALRCRRSRRSRNRVGRRETGWRLVSPAFFR
jgi:hypothetical protein